MKILSVASLALGFSITLNFLFFATSNSTNNILKNEDSMRAEHSKRILSSVEGPIEKVKINYEYFFGIPEKYMSTLLNNGDESTKPENNDEITDVTRIVGGTKSVLGRFPFMAALVYLSSSLQREVLCDGSLIAPNVILTAAHCVVDILPISVLIGCLDLNDLTTQGCQERAVIRTSVLVFPDYDPETQSGDYALLPLVTASTSTPVTLAGPNFKVLNGQELTVAGWGTTSSGGSVSSYLLQANVGLDDHDFCNSQYLFGFEIPRSKEVAAVDEFMMCASNSGKDACQGDSGGPLLMTCDEGSDIQVGIVSFGIGCAVDGFPGVYADISNNDGFNFIKNGVLSFSSIFAAQNIIAQDDLATFCLSGGTKPPTGPTSPPTSPPTFPDASLWSCDILSFNTGDGCNCGCGSPDPDCDDPAAQIIGCASTSNPNGTFQCKEGVCIEDQPLTSGTVALISIGSGFIIIALVMMMAAGAICKSRQEAAKNDKDVVARNYIRPRPNGPERYSKHEIATLSI